jgi:hypothetical protein
MNMHGKFLWQSNLLLCFALQTRSHQFAKQKSPEPATAELLIGITFLWVIGSTCAMQANSHCHRQYCGTCDVVSIELNETLMSP